MVRDPEAHVLDRDEIVKTNDRRLKIRVLQRFERENASVRELEREFALTALEMIRCQPVMAEAAGVEPDPPAQAPARRQAWPAASVELARDC
jgi:hypothetical protein